MGMTTRWWCFFWDERRKQEEGTSAGTRHRGWIRGRMGTRKKTVPVSAAQAEGSGKRALLRERERHCWIRTQGRAPANGSGQRTGNIPARHRAAKQVELEG